MARQESSKAPTKILDQALGTRVLVGLKDGRVITGKIQSYDPHLNLVFQDCEELENGEPSKKYGRLFVRGDNVIYISPK